MTIAPFEGPGAVWDQFGRSQEGWTAFHRWSWRQVIEDTFGHECIYLAATEPSGDLRGLLPLVRVRSLLFGHYLVSMPFLNYGGPIGASSAIPALAGAAADLARRGRAKLLELRSGIPLPVDLTVSHRKVTIVLDLPVTPDHLFESFPSKLRSQVRRPQKEGLEVRFGPDQVTSFYRVFASHMRDLGTPVLPREFFERIAAAFGGEAWFGCGYIGERPVAAGAGFAWNNEFEMTWASALTEYSRMAVNMGLYWAFMKRAIELGLRRFNFGRCNPGGGTHRFKLQWGGREEPLWWYQLARDGMGPASTPSPDAGPFSWGPKLWKRLPLGIANLLGPRIVRSIP